MPTLSAAEVAKFLLRLAPQVDDEVVANFLVDSILAATSQEELHECCEAWLGDGTEALAALKELADALELSQQETATAGIALKPASLPRPLAPAAADPPVHLQGDVGSSQAKGLKAGRKKADLAAPPPGEPDDSLVEFTSRVSRYYREAVEDEHTSAVAEVDIKGLCMSVAGRELLVDAHLKLCTGQRYGFVGRNGSGKSSLLRGMASGRIPGLPPNCVTLLVAQEDVGDDRNAIETVISAHSELRALLEEETILLPFESSCDCGVASRVLKQHKLLCARAALQKAAMYESKLSGLRGKAAREALLEAERVESAAEEASDATESPERQGAQQGAQHGLQVASLLADVRERLRLLGGLEAMRIRAELLLKGLGFSTEDMRKPTRLLSGGWRMRTAIGKALLAKPNVLLLDEPTNHLDWSAILWLERYLCSSEMEQVALVVVSHDRDFLDNVCTMTLRLFERQLQLHSGNYSTFEAAHEEDQEHRAQLAQRAQNKQEKVQQQIKEMEQRGRKTNNENLLKAVASRRTKLGLDGKPWSFNRVGLERVGGHKFNFSYASHFEALAETIVEHKEADVHLHLKAATPLGFDAALLQCRQVAVGYTIGKELIDKFDLDIRAKARIAILGINGTGKTTLLRTLAQELPALSGEVYQQPRAVVGFFCQHQVDALPDELSALDALMEAKPGASEAELRGHLGSFGIGRLATQPIRLLSGGERSRVALALATLRPPHVLLLDEPTNHLDLLTVEALGAALKEFQGSLVVTSHGRRLLRDVCTDFYAVQRQQLVKLSSLDAFVRTVK